MASREPAAPDRDVLPAAAAERLLDRASRLDAAREEAVSVAHLRAAELVRLLIQDRASYAKVNPTSAPRELTIRTTPATMQRAKALLGEHEGAQARTCSVPRSPAPACAVVCRPDDWSGSISAGPSPGARTPAMRARRAGAALAPCGHPAHGCWAGAARPTLKRGRVVLAPETY